jgi:hypothetical protein
MQIVNLYMIEPNLTQISPLVRLLIATSTQGTKAQAKKNKRKPC